MFLNCLGSLRFSQVHGDIVRYTECHSKRPDSLQISLGSVHYLLLCWPFLNDVLFCFILFLSTCFSPLDFIPFYQNNLPYSLASFHYCSFIFSLLSPWGLFILFNLVYVLQNEVTSDKQKQKTIASNCETE
jgi:hypothetical protein